MILSDELKPGLSGSAEIVVGTRDTAPHVGSGQIGVLATPIMVNLMEAAALQAVDTFILRAPADEGSLAAIDALLGIDLRSVRAR